VEKSVILASKTSDLETYIAKDQLLASMGGEDPYVYQCPY